jgi:antirestriction protein
MPKIHLPETMPKICVICAASYKLGILQGEWIDCTQDLEVIHCKIRGMLLRSFVDDAKEWTIYAYDGFGSVVLRPYESLEQIHHIALFLTTYGRWSGKLLEHYGKDLDLAEEAMGCHYQGKFCSELKFAEALLDKECTVPIPKFVKHYINYESFRKDVFQRDYYSIEVGKEVHIFSNSS